MAKHSISHYAENVETPEEDISILIKTKKVSLELVIKGIEVTVRGISGISVERVSCGDLIIGDNVRIVKKVKKKGGGRDDRRA